ncbi:MAG TPA: PEGA domain-containing protein [Candidatus Saccharimonadales bacterium]|nr:PEGA domain-containing protein [Candidatus Saccharimonadales bacterium]
MNRRGVLLLVALALTAALAAGCGDRLLGWQGQGTLVVTSTPPEVLVSLDGRDGMTAGTVTPSTFDSLVAGPHRVTLSLPGYLDTTREVWVRPNTVTLYAVALTQIWGTLWYRSPTSPENVIYNLMLLYHQRDSEEYGQVLASDYIFRFAPVDIVPGQPDSLLRADELSFAENLFRTGKPAEDLEPAANSSLAITIQSHGPDLRVGHSGWEKYVVNTYLTLGFADGNTLRVTGVSWFYFTQEPAGSGSWKLAEWADQGATLGSFLAVRAQGPQPARVTTWGALKRLYR